MRDDPNIFLAHVHDETYQAPFDRKILDNTSLIVDRGRRRESLGGRWSFSVDQYDSCLRQRWFEDGTVDDDGFELPVDYDFDGWERIPVPACWNLESEQYFYYEGPAVYTRTFEYAASGESRVVLKIGAVNYKATVFLNGRHIGTHYGGSTPFFADVTEFVGRQNRLIVVADNTRTKSFVPGHHTDWFNYGGIYRDVELLRLPATFIRTYNLRLVTGSGFRHIKLSVALNETRDTDAEIRIPELGILNRVSIENGFGELTIEADPELWSPSNPKLYDVEIRCDADRVTDRIGFREIRVVGGDILLNGERILLKGICCHEDSVQSGKAVSDEEIVRNFRIVKEMNGNFVRLAHYPHSDRVAQIADEMGVLLWEEIPVYWAIDFDNERTYLDAENQLSELILRDRNRASVIMWSVGNENPDTDARFRFMNRLVQTARNLDESRLVSAACLIDHIHHRISDRLADSLDIIAINEYYGWLNPNFDLLQRLFDNSSPSKPVVISELGAAAGYRGSESQLFSEERQRAVYRKQIACIEGVPYVKGMSPWILFDYRSPRRTNSHQRGFNRKGLLSADKTHRKLAFNELKRFYAVWATRD